MTSHRHYNKGPMNYLLGHGIICDHRPPRTMMLEGFNPIVMSSTYDTVWMHLFWDTHHKEILKCLVNYSAACSSTDEVDAVVSKYSNLIHLTVPYIQHVSPRYMPDRTEMDFLLGGHDITINKKTQDIRYFESRVSLLTEHKTSLMLQYRENIKTFQKTHMGFKLDKSEMHCWEIRESIISYPYGLNIEDNPDMTPPADQYFKRNYIFKQFIDYTGAIK